MTLSPGGDLFTEVSPSDAPALLDHLLSTPRHMTPPLDPPTLRYLVQELERTEALQAGKVTELARRLRPGLTPEDLRNPHDFPELRDPDWHYQDGQLAAYQATLALLRRLLRGAS